jgi:hypothetical protein
MSVNQEKREWQTKHHELQRELKECVIDDRFYTSLGLGKEWKAIQRIDSDATDNLRGKVLRVVYTLKIIKESIKDNHSVDKTKEFMHLFESRLKIIKQQVRDGFDATVQEEQVLEKALSEVDLEQIDAHDNSTTQATAHRKEQTKRIANTFEKALELQSQVGSIDRELADLGGRCGDWDSRDHDIFLRSVTQALGIDAAFKLKSSSNIVTKLMVVLPGKNQIEIEEHIARLACT